MTRRLPTLTRGECREWVLPCRLTQCRYHLDHDTRGRGQYAGPGKPRTVSTQQRQRSTIETCALNIADEGERSGHAIADLLGYTQQAINHTEAKALRKLANSTGERLKLLRELTE